MIDLTNPPAPGFVRIAIPVFVRNADEWISWEVDRLKYDDAMLPREERDAVEVAREFVRGVSRYGTPHVVVVDLPIPSIPESEAFEVPL